MKILEKRTPSLHPAELTALLRTGLLALKPEDIGFSTHQCPAVWGMMIECGLPNLVVSLAALLDGSVSVYVSDGGSLIACGLHPTIRLAAHRLLCSAISEAHVHPIVKSYPLPEDGQVCFYLLTTTGVRLAQVERSRLEEGEVELAELYHEGYNILAMIDALGAGHGLADEIAWVQEHPEPVQPAMRRRAGSRGLVRW